MALSIEDYALISDCHTGALVGRNGSIDWLCFPRYDSAAMFAALLGSSDHGRWLIAPEGEDKQASRSYLDHSFVLRTEWTTPTGRVEVLDFMSMHNHRADVVRRVRGLEGSVDLHLELEIRFGYGDVMPWMRRLDRDGAGAAGAAGGDGVRGTGHERNALLAVAGPDAVVLRGPELPRATDHRHESVFTVRAGETHDYTLTWFASHHPTPEAFDVDEALEETLDYWNRWSAASVPSERYTAEVIRSLMVLRALTHESTGGIVAAVTTSLPEQIGSERNWDYRYCWLRDAALTLSALLAHGFHDEVGHWRDWLLRAVAGDPEDLQIMYGLGGERELPERELPHLPGYEDSTPVRIGNAAVEQYQADVIGEVLVAFDFARSQGIEEDAFSWPLQRSLLQFLDEHRDDPDNGIWEVRGDKHHFTHSRVMVWAAFDRGVRAVERYGLDGDVQRWRHLREELREEILREGYDHRRGTFVQYYGSTAVDASLLILPQVGFLDHDDERMLGTVKALEEDLLRDGLLLRYETERGVDGLPPGEHQFLACSFWLVEQYARTGRVADAEALMKRLISVGNDLGLYSEEYDTDRQRMVGNFPQAFSHLALVRAADALSEATGTQRASSGPR